MIPDLLAGGTGNFGKIEVWRGNEDTLIHSVFGEAPDDELGSDVSGFTDLDGDGRAEFLGGAWKHDGPAGADSGRAYVFAGADAGFLMTFDGEAAGDRFGASIADVADLDADGVPDFAVGAPFHDGPAGADAGRVYVYSGATGALVRAIDGSAAGERFGRALEGAGDVDGDGAGDLVVGGVAAAAVISGDDGAVLHAFASGFELFGRSVDGAGDYDGDGVPDVVVGGKDEAFVFSGASGASLVRVFSAEVFAAPPFVDFGDFGASVAGLGDLNGDGRSEIVVGAPKYFGFSLPEFGMPDGAAFVYSAARTF